MAKESIDRLFTRGPVIFMKWHRHDNWPVQYISANISRLGYHQNEFIEKRIRLTDIIHPSDSAAFFDKLEVSLSGKSSKVFNGELRLMDTSNKIHPMYYHAVFQPARKKTGEDSYFYGFFVQWASFNKKRSRKESAIEYQAYHDALTGLPNRCLLNDRLKMEIIRSSRDGNKFGVMFLDLDNFKDINDTLGHIIGDMMLQEAAKRLLRCIRDGDTVSRIGGDEFTILLPQISNPKEIARVAERILGVFEEPFHIKHHELYSSISIGICIYPTDGKSSIDLMKNSDLAMYHAKEQGKNNYVYFSEEMNIQMKKRLDLENQLRRALNENQFVLYYQPLVNLKTGNIAGVEALVRWCHPDSGLMAPMDFIPLAEETGMILKLGQWVLTASCEQNFAWKNEGIDSLYVSVNISTRQFFHYDFLESVLDILDKNGITSGTGFLTLQLTENSIMGRKDKIIRIMKELKKIGINLSIDDFGKGFSSLDRLRRYPIDTLKIDRSFIKGIPENTDCIAVARSIISLARNLRLKVLAEGVETEDQLKFLLENGCDLFQGYYFSPPVPPDKITRMIKEKKNLYH
jgi:diguanylate cyclase (GGDEF)-like protein